MPGHGAFSRFGALEAGGARGWPFEPLDDDHASAAARARRADVSRFFRSVVFRRRSDVQQFARECEAGLAGGAGEQPIVTDAVEPTWEDMEQEGDG